MTISEILAALNILIAFLGVLFVAFTVFEWQRLKKLREDMQDIEARTNKHIYESFKAAHRVLASYQITNPEQRSGLLETAVAAYPDTYNAFNALGYAYMEMGQIHKAIDAFSQAVNRHPEDKAGYCDLAYAHKVNGSTDLALKYLRLGLALDPTVKEDLANDCRLSDLLKSL